MYGKMMIEELKRFFNTDELKPSIVVLDVGVFFPYANQDILKFDMGLNELPLDAGRFDDMKFNHRYPNRNYVTLSCINERKISRVGYPIIGEVAEMTGEKYLCIAYIYNDPHRFDVIALHSGNDDYIKRIIGLPGETIWINENSEVCINNLIINDPYAKEQILSNMKGIAEDPIVLGNNEYFVMGDNRNESMDSRTFGPITKDQIIGKIRETKKYN